MNGLLEIVRTVIEQYGYSGIFFLTALEQFIFPVPADIFVTIGTSVGLAFKKVLLVVLIAAFIGSLIGYFLGRYLGHPILVWLFGQRKLDRAEKFIEKWGVWGVILAGLTPIPFKVVTVTAGAFEMPLGRYLIGVLLGRMPRYLITAYLGTLVYESKFYATPEMSAILLGAIQGVTEFLPISSSGHLTIMEHFLHLPSTLTPQNLEIFDIFLHAGSLLAIVLYFWKDWWKVLQEIGEMFKDRAYKMSSLTNKLILGTLPAIAAGLLFAQSISNHLRTLKSVAIFFVVIAVYFLYAEWKGKRNEIERISLKKAVMMGAAQAFALIPGVSRAGTTIATGMILGLKREVAAKFSFMLGGIAILAANVYALLSLRNGATMPDITFTLIGFATSFLVSLVAVNWLMKYLHSHTLRAFSFYLILMGALILSLL